MSLGTNVNFLLVFLEGVVSFFSPCVIPLIPLYMGYLAGGAKTTDLEGRSKYSRRSIMIHTIFFILGISSAFFILGLGFSSLGTLLNKNSDIFSKVGGAIIILMGLNQLGLFRLKFLNRELRINKQVSNKNMNPIVAFVMGFGFSFAWTPCVGPALASVLILASNANSVLVGNLYVLLYSVGFLIPFIVLGLFTGETLNFIKKKPQIMDIIVKVGGLVLVIMGLMLILGTFSKFESLFNPSDNSGETNTAINDSVDKSKRENSNKKDSDTTNKAISDTKGEDKKKKTAKDSEENKNTPKMKAIELKDQNGNIINIEKDYKGKVVFLNFFATWCPPCRAEIPDIQKLYEDNGYNKRDVVVIAVASPGQGREKDEAGVKEFIKNNGITYPVLMDNTGKVFQEYGVYSLPTTYLIDKQSKIYGYITGGIPRKIMDNAVDDALHNRPIE